MPQFSSIQSRLLAFIALLMLPIVLLCLLAFGEHPIQVILLMGVETFVVLVAYLGGRRLIQRSCHTFYEITARLDGGDLAGRLNIPPDGPREMIQLAQMFNKMAATLEKRTVELRESETKFRYIFANNPHPMWLADLETAQFLDVNDTALTQYGYSRDEFLALNLTDIRPESDIPRFLESFHRDYTGTQQRGHWRHRLRDGKIMDVDVVTHSFVLNGRKATMAVIQDITERLRTEKDLQYRLGFENLITQISTQFVNSSVEDLPSVIQHALESLGKFVGTDRCAIALFGESDSSDSIVPYYWAEKSLVRPQQSELVKKSSPWMVDKFKRNEIVQISTLDDVPPELANDKQAMQTLGIKSYIAVPLSNGHHLIGYLSMSATGTEITWSDDHVVLLKITAEMFTNVILRQRADTEIRKLNADLEWRVDERTSALQKEISEHQDTENRLRTSEESYRMMADNASDLISRHFLNGDIIYVSPACQALLGYTVDELVGRNTYDLLHVDDIPILKERYQSLRKTGNTTIATYRIRRRDDSYIWAETTFRYIRNSSDSRALEIIAVSRDITERVEAEKHLRERTAQVETANKELEAFSYSISHDLRSPLRALNGFARIILTDYDATLTPETRRYFMLIQENATRMGHLIDDLLAFARLSRQPLREHLVVPTALVKTVLAELEPEFQNRRIETTVCAMPNCRADPSLLKQVYTNLISNAIKFTRTRPNACIEIGNIDRDGDVIYYVKDNGVGFDMRYSHKLFGVFQRLHRTEDYEGTGVGLAIVQRIILRHGGRVWAESQVDQGATFYFMIGALQTVASTEITHDH